MNWCVMVNTETFRSSGRHYKNCIKRPFLKKKSKVFKVKLFIIKTQIIANLRKD